MMWRPKDKDFRGQVEAAQPSVEVRVCGSYKLAVLQMVTESLCFKEHSYLACAKPTVLT
jgi:hypothetical protein